MPADTIDMHRLATMTTNALERTAFMLVDEIPDADIAADNVERTCACIEYTGPSHGRVTVAASEGFIIELASSLLGVEPDEVEAQNEGMDALRELANIMGGSVVTELGGDENDFRLGLPAAVDAIPTDTPGVQCVLDSCGETLIVCWQASVGEAKLAA